MAVFEMRMSEKYLLQGSGSFETRTEKGDSHSPLSKTGYHGMFQKNGVCLVINADIGEFIDPCASWLKHDGFQVLRDEWNWGKIKEESWSRHCLNNADILFCEWGGQCSLVFSPQYLWQAFVYQIHLQEINERAARLTAKIKIENVTMVVFVSERVRRKALEMWGWPEGRKKRHA